MARFRLDVGPVPLHHQVYLDLTSALDAGEWKPGDRLPPERELAERYGCSLITVRRALSELSRERRLERTRGRGTFVLQPRLELDFGGSQSFTSEMQRRGLDPETRLVAARPEAAGEAVATRARAWSSARRRSTSSGSGSPTASRCSSSRSTCRPSASRACSPRTSSTTRCTSC